MWYDEEDLEPTYYGFWAEGDASKELESFYWKNLIPKIERVTTILDWDGDYADEGYEEIVINAETGEEYFPKETKSIKLRRK